MTLVSLVVAALCVLVVATVIAVPRQRAVVTAAGVVIPIVMAVQALQVVQTWWPRSDLATFYPVTATHEFLREHLGADRYISVNWTLLPATSPYYELRAATGHAFLTPQWKALLLAASDDAMATPTNGTMTLDGLTSPALDRMAVRYAVVDPRARIPGSLAATSDPSSTSETTRTAMSAPVTGPVRGVQLILPAGLDAGGGAVRVSLVTEDGTTLATTSQEVTASSEPFGTWVALAGEDIPADESFRVVLGVPNGSSVTVPVDNDGNWAVNVVRPAPDGLKVVFTDGTTVYERLGAESRFHWASDDRVITDEGTRLRAIASGAVPASTVILERTSDAQASDRASTAHIAVEADEGDRVQLKVDATGNGYMVFSESVRAGGWTATLDGQPTTLIPADGAMAAVYVTSGEHVVAFRYVPRGLHTGLLVSGTSALVMVTGVGMLLWHRRRRTVPARHAIEAPNARR